MDEIKTLNELIEAEKVKADQMEAKYIAEQGKLSRSRRTSRKFRALPMSWKSIIRLTKRWRNSTESSRPSISNKRPKYSLQRTEKTTTNE